MASTETSAGEAPPGRARFDMAERARIRTAMLRYMETHRIGVPALQARISEAVNRPVDLIPLKTLQRFLAASTRTNDAFLVPCHQFVSGLPDYAGAIETGAEALPRLFREFLSAGLSPVPASHLSQDAVNFEGHYSLFILLDPAQVPEGSALPGNSLTYATMIVTATEDKSGLSVQEYLHNPAVVDIITEPSRSTGHHHCEGVLTAFEGGPFILLRNNLTRLPKAYALRRDPADPLFHEGYLLETPLLAPDGGALVNHWVLPVRLMRTDRRLWESFLG
jgi:hypothetical protein